MRIPNLKLPNLKLPACRRLSKRRLIILAFSVITLIIVATFFTKFGFTAFSIKEKPPACVDECDFEGKTCENAKIFECNLGEDGCKHKIVIEECGEGAKCSILKDDECYTPESCDGNFHICISDFLYQMCKDGKTVEDAETKKCPTGLMCNRNSEQFALCVESDY